MKRRSRTRRALLRGVSGTIAASVGGCLRVTERGGDATTDATTDTTTETTTEAADGTAETETTTAANTVELETIRSLERTGSDIVTFDGQYYLNTFDAIRRLDPDGTDVWSAETEDEENYFASSGVAADASRLYWGYAADDDTEQALGGKIKCFSQEDGTKQWEFEVEADGMHHYVDSLAAVSSDLLVAGADDTGSGEDQEPQAYGIDPATGSQLWRTADFPPGFIETVFAYDGAPYVVTLEGLFRCNPDDGSVTTVSEVYSGFGKSALDGDTLYLPGSPLRRYDLDDETVRWETEVTGNVKTRPAVGSNTVFAGTDTGHVYALDKRTGTELWQNRVTAQVETVELTEGHVWIADEIGMLNAFGRGDGETAYEEPSEERDQRAMASVGNTLFVERTGLVRVRPA